MALIFVFHLELQELDSERHSMQIDDEGTVKDYYELRQQLDTYGQQMRDVVNHPNYSLQFMQPGRLVRVRYKDVDFGWGAVVNYSRRIKGKVGLAVSGTVSSLTYTRYSDIGHP